MVKSKFVILFFFISLPLISKEIYKVNADTLRIRKHPSSTSEIVGKMKKGSEISIISKSEVYEEIEGITSEWIEIETKDENRKYKGYIFGAFIESENSSSQFIKCKKSKNGIVIFLDNEKKISLKNGNTDEDGYLEFTEYHSCKYLKILDSVLVDYTIHEGGGYKLYSLKNGKITKLWGSPIFSENKNYFACFSADIEAQFYPNGIQIFNSDFYPKKEFELEFDSSDMNRNFQPTDINWITEKKLKIILNNIDSTRTKKVFIEKINEKWKVVNNQ